MRSFSIKMILLHLMRMLLLLKPCFSAWISSAGSNLPKMMSPLKTSFRSTGVVNSKQNLPLIHQVSWSRDSVMLFQSNPKPFELLVDMPPSGSQLQAQMKIDPLLSTTTTTGQSEIIQVRYRLPFDLNVEPRNNLAVCTRDGPGGEKKGDILRYTSAWTMGMPQGNGLMSQAAVFAGGISWRCYLFDVMKAKRWEEVVEALTSNIPSRTDEVVLLFERQITETTNE